MMTTLWVYNTLSADGALRARYDQRPWEKKCADKVLSIVRQILFLPTFWYHRLTSTPQQCGQAIQWDSQSRGLIVFLHGLRSDPAMWHEHLSFLQPSDHIDIFAPVLPKRGMCSLDEAAAPVLPTVVDYIAQHPGNPVCLLGHSNGSRVVSLLEIKLRDQAPQTPVLVSTVAGVHFGSSWMSCLESFGIAKLAYPLALRQELSYGSPKAIELFNQMAARLPLGCERFFSYYASTEDMTITELDSSLPEIGQREQFNVVHGHSHDSIVRAVAGPQMNACQEWIDCHQHSILNSDSPSPLHPNPDPDTLFG